MLRREQERRAWDAEEAARREREREAFDKAERQRREADLLAFHDQMDAIAKKATSPQHQRSQRLLVNTRSQETFPGQLRRSESQKSSKWY